MNRDTQRFAVKCSSITVSKQVPVPGGELLDRREQLTDIDVFKDPITDPGKASKRGRVTTWFDTEAKQYVAGTVGNQPNMHCIEALVPIFEDGKLLVDDSLETIRNRT